MSEKSTRIYGFDILRIATVMAILYFHVWQYTFFQDVISLPPEISNYHNLTGWVGDVFKYGGLFIVALSFFLIGLKARSQHKMRFFVLIAGLIGLQVSTADNPMDPTTWDWDVYSYLVLSYILVLALPRKAILRWPFVAASIALLCIPYEQYAPLLNIPEAIQFSGWNLMPWLALPVLFHSAGVLWSQKTPGFFQAMHKWEWPVWVALIALLFVITPDYGPFPAGPGFEGYVFKQKPLMFWKHFIVFAFLMRLSLDPVINSALARIKGMSQFSNLAWNKHLGVSYFMHLALLPMGQHLMEFWGHFPGTFDWLWLFIFISVEIIVRAMFAMRLTVKAKVAQLMR
ncbi:hypothetical protein ACLSU7_11495 [Bdellovibrio sp. HCB185ZH]|uniref:hypothetical protein n=1 Tax=Bdellovibrio sp. HCB185ZH TaxID=3394235 RepID=UPI0039A7200C